MSESKYHLFRAIIAPPVKHHLNGVSLACQWWPIIECLLSSFVIFQGIRICLAKKPYTVFCDFSAGRGGPDPLSPRLDPHMGKLTISAPYLRASSYGSSGYSEGRIFSDKLGIHVACLQYEEVDDSWGWSVCWSPGYTRHIWRARNHRARTCDFWDPLGSGKTSRRACTCGVSPEMYIESCHEETTCSLCVSNLVLVPTKASLLSYIDWL